MIPTAEKFIEEKYSDVPGELNDITDLMIEFAKFHVTEALKKAAEKAEINCDCDGDEWCKGKINKNSILKSYDLDNIK